MSILSLEPLNSYENPLVSGFEFLFAPQNIRPLSTHFFVTATAFLISPLNFKVVAGENGKKMPNINVSAYQPKSMTLWWKSINDCNEKVVFISFSNLGREILAN